jgi:hypothetical protein
MAGPRSFPWRGLYASTALGPARITRPTDGFLVLIKLLPRL